MENNGATPILIETATVPGTEACEVRNADNEVILDCWPLEVLNWYYYYFIVFHIVNVYLYNNC